MMKTKHLLHLLILLTFGLTFVACSSDDDESSNSPLVGTWTMQVQWADTNGTRDHSYTFKGNGTGTFKFWDNFDQKYYYQNFKWSATESVISFDMEKLPDGSGYSSGIRYYTLTPNCLTMYYSDGDFDGNYFKE